MANADYTETQDKKFPATLMKHEEVASCFDSCSSAFGHIRAILRAIEKQASEYSEIKALAGAASYIASDYENLADCWREDAIDASSNFVKSESNHA